MYILNVGKTETNGLNLLKIHRQLMMIIEKLIMINTILDLFF